MRKTKGKIMADEQKYQGICVSSPTQAAAPGRQSAIRKIVPILIAAIIVVCFLGGALAVLSPSSEDDTTAESESSSITDTESSSSSEENAALARANCIDLDKVKGLTDSQTSMLLTALGTQFDGKTKVVFSSKTQKDGNAVSVYCHPENDAQWYEVEVTPYRASVLKLTEHVKGVNDAQWNTGTNVGDTTDSTDNSEIPRDRYDTSMNVALRATDKLVELGLPQPAATALPSAFDEWGKKELLSVESAYAGVYPLNLKSDSKKVKFEIDADDGNTTVVVDCTYDIAKNSLSFKRVEK